MAGSGTDLVVRRDTTGGAQHDTDAQRPGSFAQAIEIENDGHLHVGADRLIAFPAGFELPFAHRFEGRIVERGPATEVCGAPRHAATRALFASALVLD